MLTTQQSKAMYRKLAHLGSKNYQKDYHRLYIKYWRLNRRLKAIISLGGHCVRCHSVRGLEFDHINRWDKTVKSDRLMTCDSKTFWREIKKCQLLCHYCHRLKTIEEERNLVM
jgi:hypothetical protein